MSPPLHPGWAQNNYEEVERKDEEEEEEKK